MFRRLETGGEFRGGMLHCCSNMMSGGGEKSITFTFLMYGVGVGLGGQALLTETCRACEEGLVEVLVVDGHGLHQG